MITTNILSKNIVFFAVFYIFFFNNRFIYIFIYNSITTI